MFLDHLNWIWVVLETFAHLLAITMVMKEEEGGRGKREGGEGKREGGREGGRGREERRRERGREEGEGREKGNKKGRDGSQTKGRVIICTQ